MFRSKSRVKPTRLEKLSKGDKRPTLDSVTAETRYRTTLDSMLEGCQIISPDWRYLYVNDTVAKQGRRTKEELLGHTMMEMYPGIEHTQLFAVLNDCMNNRLTHRIENKFTYPTGDEGWFDLSIQPVPEGIFILSMDITERKRMEEELRRHSEKLEQVVAERTGQLRESEEKFRGIAERSFDAIFTLDLEGRITYASPAAEKMSGYGAAELVGNNLRLFLSESEVGKVMEAFARTIGGEMVESLQVEGRRKDGSSIQIEVHASPIVKDGQTVGVQGVIRDIIKRKRAEEGLRESEEKYRTLVENLPHRIFLKDRDSVYVSCNTVFAQDMEMTPNEIQGHTDHDFYPKDLAERFIEEDRRVIESGTIVELDEEYEAGGERIIVHTVKTPVKDEKGNTIGVLGILWDIRERKRMEESLRESENQFRLVTDNLPALVGYVDSNRRYRFVNRTYEEYHGLPRTEIVGRHVSEMLGDSVYRRVQPNIDKVLSGQTVRHDTEVDFKIRGRRHVDAIYVPHFGEDGQVRGYFVLLNDITKRKQMEDELRRSERELNIRNRIADIFLKVPDEEMYGEVLNVILEVMESKYGVFGYINEDRALVVPSMTRHIWDKCQVADKRTVFPREQWGDSSWPRAIREKKTNYTNEPSAKVPEGHLPIRRHISLPILHQGEVVGLIQVANRETDYSENDVQLLETVGDIIAPILRARLERDRHEIERKRVEERLKESSEVIKKLNEALVERIIEKTGQIERISKLREEVRRVPDVSSGLGLILDAVRTDLGMDMAAVLVIDAGSDSATLAGIKGETGVLEVGERHPLDAAFVEFEKMKGGKAFFEILGKDKQSILRAVTVCGCPVFYGRQLYGILALGSRKELVLDESDLQILGLYSELVSTVFEGHDLVVVPVKEAAAQLKRRFEIERGEAYVVKDDVEMAFNAFVDNVLGGLDGLCITRELPEKFRTKYGLRRTPIVWLTDERSEKETTVHSLQDLSILVATFLEKSKGAVVLLDGIEYLITNHGFEPCLRFLQTCRNRFQQNDSILLVPLFHGALDSKQTRLLERETKPLTLEIPKQ